MTLSADQDLTPAQTIKMGSIRLAAAALISAIERECPNSNQRDFALRNIENAIWHADQAVRLEEPIQN